MSTPQHPHKLREEQAKGAGGEYVAARYAQMHCDSEAFLRCPLAPIRAPRVVVPAKQRYAGSTPEMLLFFDRSAPPIYKFTTLHFCERHTGECTVEKLLDSRSPYGRWNTRTDIERIAKQKWPHDYKPAFDYAKIEWMLTTTPEYRRFLELLEERWAEQGVTVDPYNGVPIL